MTISINFFFLSIVAVIFFTVYTLIRRGLTC